MCLRHPGRPSPCRSTSKRTRLVMGYCLMMSSTFFTYRPNPVSRPKS